MKQKKVPSLLVRLQNSDIKNTAQFDNVCFWIEPDDPRKVIVKRLVLVPADKPEIALDLTGDLSQLKKETFIIKEGVSYKIRIEFIVQREIVHGLKYVQQTYKLGIPG